MKRLKSLSEKRIRTNSFITAEFSRSLSEISRELSRQIGVLIDRSGNIHHLIVGTDSSIEIPYLDRIRTAESRFRGLRLFHSHLKDEPLNQEDLTDLVLLRLDYITAVAVDSSGIPKYYYSAHVNPNTTDDEPWVVLPKVHPGQIPEGFLDEIQALEAEFNRRKSQMKDSQKENRAFLVGVYDPKFAKRSPESSLAELKELCKTAGIHVVDHYYQRKAMDSSTVIGKGKLQDIMLKAVQKDVELLVFDLELAPAQAKKISDTADLKIIDRTQLILDIFARNAKSRDGKLQVELAQLKYLKGRLSELDDNMSRLTGGIGGRGPGETKLEIGNRRVSDRINRLENELKNLRKRRELNRKQRSRNHIPVVGIVGYTNAGKSTLLNALTNSEVIAENKLFATLDPTTRRIRFPEEREIIISDTVGFIHDLPPELSHAFKATLEELGDADMLIHLVDISNPEYREQMSAVDTILGSLDLNQVPQILVFNKMDAYPGNEEEGLPNLDGLFISAEKGEGLEKLLDYIEENLFPSSLGFIDRVEDQNLLRQFH